MLCSGKQPNQTPPEGCTGPSNGSTAGGGTSTEHYQGNSGALTLFSLLLGLGAHSPNYNTDCHYTWSYTYYAADIVDGHGGAQSDLEGLYTPGKVPAAGDDQAVCGLAGLLAGINTFANLPPNPPTSWNIGGYPVTCTWHSFPGGQLEYWQVGSTLYWHGCFAVPAPTNTAAPVVTPGSGVLKGDGLHTTDGTWTHLPDSYTYTWQSCPDSSGNGCSNIASGDNDYTAAQGDVGKYLRAAVVAVNEGGPSAPAYSNIVGPVGVMQNTLAPTIGVQVGGNCNAAATATETQRLCIRNPGPTWNPAAQSLTYQWQSDGAGNLGNNSTLNLSPANTGHTITVLVTGHRNSGADSDPVASNGINVTATPPSGTVAVGACGTTINSARPARRTRAVCPGSAPINYTYDWRPAPATRRGRYGLQSARAGITTANYVVPAPTPASSSSSPSSATQLRKPGSHVHGVSGSTVTACNPPSGSVQIAGLRQRPDRPGRRLLSADTSGISGTARSPTPTTGERAPCGGDDGLQRQRAYHQRELHRRLQRGRRVPQAHGRCEEPGQPGE